MTEHNVLRRQAKGEGEDVLVQCVDCQEVQTLHLRPGKAVSITSILSDGADSRTDYVEADDDEKISVGDVFEHDEILYKITRLDDSESRPKKIIDARDISTLWAVRCDKAVVRLTMTDGEESRSKTIECSPEDVFSCGSIMEVDGERWRIRALHTGRGRTLRGKRSAMDIKRVYLHPPYGRVRGEDRRDTRDYRDDRRDDYRRDTRQR
uniref:Putative archaeal Zn-finger protein n=1 Tax=uncultured marine group II/III euryarchaeote KM3_72_E02 TaxID=1456498 RepID=A0A075HLB2_9EURY|nr:putative archaeal Zn-finger protein [uncultured marine group II/III euryarchaeote KM3_72_E02]